MARTRSASNSPIRWLLIEPDGVVQLRRGERGFDGPHFTVPSNGDLWKSAQALLQQIEEAIDRGEVTRDPI